MKQNLQKSLFTLILLVFFFMHGYTQLMNPLHTNTNRTVIDPTLPDPNAPTVIDGWSYAWGDEFNYTGKPNPSMWSYEIGFARNSELQWYQSDNANVSAGRLLIEGRRETFPNPNYVAGSGDWKTNRQYVNYTSSSIITLNKRQFYQGRMEVRAKLDTRKGNWPAIWTLGQNKEWPQDGEIDILEYYLMGSTPSILSNFVWGSATRWVGTWNSKVKPLSYFIAKDANWVEKYHIWRMDWDDTVISLYLDDELLNSQTIANAKNADGSICFNQPQNILLNLAIGANGGDPSSTVFPTKYEVDYFRIYQKTVDLEKPTVVSNVVASNISKSSCTLTWTPSNDNIGVMAYHVYNNGRDAGSYLGSTTTNSINITGLAANSNTTIYVRAIDAVGNYSDMNTATVVKTISSLSGSVINDNGGIYQDNQSNAPSKVFDNNASTFYDANTASGAWVGLNLNSKFQITRIRFCPRSTYNSRMTGGKFQASNSADFSTGVIDLTTIATEIPAGTWGDVLVNNTSDYQYVRYLSPANGFCNVAEIEFYGQKLSPSGFTETLAPQLTIYPNPISDMAHFQANGVLEPVKLVVTNIAGQVVMKKNIARIDGFNLDLSAYASGLYHICISNNSFRLTKRLYKK